MIWFERTAGALKPYHTILLLEADATEEELVYQILSLVEEIPEGRVATYGQLARLIGREKNSRLVGSVLSRAELYGSYPCHRVVNHCGRTAPGWPEQAELLRREGVPLDSHGRVDLRLYQWDCR